MSSSLLNRAATRQYILTLARDLRPGWRCTRVSAEAIERIEVRLRELIRSQVEGHPTRGQTFRP